MVEIYTDGACSHSSGAGGWSVVKVEEGEDTYTAGGRADVTTCNRMELTAMIKGVELAILHPNREEAITIFSDSKYVVRGINEWIPKWKKNGWRKGTIANKDLWIDLLTAMNKWNNNRKVELLSIEWIKGHNGNKWNELADTLAVRSKNCDPN